MKKLFLNLLLLGIAVSPALGQANFIKTPKGALYTIVKQGNGAKVKQGDVITFQFSQKTDKDSLLGSSFQMGRPAKAQVQPSKNVADLMEVFSLLSVNDSVLVRVPTDSIFTGMEDKRPPFLPKGSYMNFGIKLEKIQTYDEAMAEAKVEMEKARAEQTAMMEKWRKEEVPSINAYVADKKLTPLSTASGLRYLVTAPGNGPKPKAYDTVVVNYTGRLLDGKVFDSSLAEVAKAAALEQTGRNYEPIKFLLGNGEVIPGWDEGLLLLNEGAKATFIIPSALAYGERGSAPVIRPFSPLVFDVELVKIIKGTGKPPVASRGVLDSTSWKSSGKKPVAKKKAPTKKPVAKKKVTRK
ncbi:FKBP-type peptidyl-prolyl cis-trans isomerase [Mucilaginibacter sp. PAMB04274]|uniref:FKBP-type peptidyl-prolyl cis-trans isomerase n=1 Tax=Mucilaginibacter sp. PAMB04274 TaxID=3138568 RepID=UPI0031F6D39C